nr:MAG TPA: hypothetical protein [Caudoviricetes sp.]
MRTRVKKFNKQKTHGFRRGFFVKKGGKRT